MPTFAEREALRVWLHDRGVSASTPTLLDAILSLFRGIYGQDQ